MKFIALLMLLGTSLAFAQETLDVRFLLTQRTSGTSFSVPISVNGQGEISLFGDNGTSQLSFQPTLQVGFTRAVIEYSAPVLLNRFNFYPVQKELGWIEVKRQRIEYGMGLSSIIKSATTVGLIPYKGSLQTIIRNKTSQQEKSLPFRMPKRLEDLVRWNEGDHGTFQTYGGIEAYAGFSAGIVDVATVSFGLQNQFMVEIRKLAKNEISIRIGEENLKSRQLKVGPWLTYGAVANFKGKRFSAEFKLDITNPDHHHLFEEALDGNIKLLQETLPHKAQKLSWIGHDRSFYFGIPSVAGKTISRGHYDLNEDGVETELDFKGSKNKGYLTPLRNHQNFVYQTEEGMVVVWTSEMNKTDERALEKNFLSKGRIIGIKNFDRDLPNNTKFGSVVSQIGIHVSRKEVDALKTADFELVTTYLKERCEKEKLSCRKEKNITKIVQKLKNLLTKPWKEMRGDMGLLMIKEPALIHAVVKAMKYKKEVYFKFLSERYQSMEGSSPIEF